MTNKSPAKSNATLLYIIGASLLFVGLGSLLFAGSYSYVSFILIALGCVVFVFIPTKKK